MTLVSITNSAVALPHQNQVWPAHSGCLLAFHLCLHLLFVHLALLYVLDRSTTTSSWRSRPSIIVLWSASLQNAAHHPALGLSHPIIYSMTSIDQLGYYNFTLNIINFRLCNIDYFNIILRILLNHILDIYFDIKIIISSTILIIQITFLVLQRLQQQHLLPSGHYSSAPSSRP